MANKESRVAKGCREDLWGGSPSWRRCFRGSYWLLHWLPQQVSNHSICFLSIILLNKLNCSCCCCRRSVFWGGKAFESKMWNEGRIERKKEFQPFGDSSYQMLTCDPPFIHRTLLATLSLTGFNWTQLKEKRRDWCLQTAVFHMCIWTCASNTINASMSFTSLWESPVERKKTNGNVE